MSEIKEKKTEEINEAIESPDEMAETEESPLVKKSILLTIKKMLGIQGEDRAFDADILVFINSAFNVLTQLGAGPKNGFSIESDRESWSDFTNDEIQLNMIKSYIFLKTKISFDPSQMSAAVLEAHKAEIKELEWRINIQVDLEGAFDKEHESHETK